MYIKCAPQHIVYRAREKACNTMQYILLRLKSHGATFSASRGGWLWGGISRRDVQYITRIKIPWRYIQYTTRWLMTAKVSSHNVMFNTSRGFHFLLLHCIHHLVIYHILNILHYTFISCYCLGVCTVR